MEGLVGKDPRVFEKLSYVLLSGQRERVLAAVVPAPTTPTSVSRDTGMRLPHVSRALRQLSKSGLVTRVGDTRVGKLYMPSDLGRAVFEELGAAHGDATVPPMIRGTHYQIYFDWISRHHGVEAARAIFAAVAVDSSRLGPRAWYSIRPALRILELIEERFGDGTCETIRTMFREGAASMPSIQRVLRRALPFHVQLEFGPAVYNREFNHGRLEVEVRNGWALFRSFDWISSPARCAAWQGAYEGVMILKGLRPNVTKVACRRKGSEYCGYIMEW